MIELQIQGNIPRTPINIYNLLRELLSHPDQTYVQALIANLQCGCDIGYRGSQFAHVSNNLTSASQQPDILEANITTECQAGRILGPFDTPPLPNFRCSGLGLVPKHDGGWRAIYRLSASYGSSINDSISSQDYTLSYCSVNDAFAIVSSLIFLRRLLDLSCKLKRMHHHRRLTTEACLDLDWWLAFLPTWSGTSYILESNWSTSPSMALYTEASGTLGWGAYWAGHWIQAHWLPGQIGRDIAWKELFAIASAVNTWGHYWPRKKLLVHCDNQGVVDIWKKGTTDHPQFMALVRMLYFCAARHNIHVIITHIDDTTNCIADALSRFQA